MTLNGRFLLPSCRFILVTGGEWFVGDGQLVFHHVFSFGLNGFMIGFWRISNGERGT